MSSAQAWLLAAVAARPTWPRRALSSSPAKGAHPYFHFHIDFLPIQRSAKKLKYLAGIESGCGTSQQAMSPPIAK